MWRNVISVIDAGLNRELYALRVHEIAKNITVFEGLSNEAWDLVSKIIIHNCFRPSGFYLSSKEIKALVARQTDLSAKLYNEWMNIDEEV